MAKKQAAKKKKAAAKPEAAPPKDFLDMIAPAAVKFNTDSYILGGAHPCTLALRGYPTRAPRSWPCCGIWARRVASPCIFTPVR